MRGGRPGWSVLSLTALALAACSGGQCGGCSSSSGAGGEPSARPSATPPEASSPAAATFRILWHQTFANDIDAAAAFYAGVAGWTVRKDNPDRVTCAGRTGPVASIQRITPEMRAAGVQPYWGVFVQVSDVDATVNLAGARGARAVLPPTDIPGARVASFVDGVGAMFSIARWTPPPPPWDPRVPGEFFWDELVTRDADGSARLLGDLFGWTKLRDDPVGPARYLTFARDGIPVAGLLARPDLPVAGWISYVQVADLDAAIGRAQVAGATVALAPFDTPTGRFAQLRDPQGAFFGLATASAAR